MVQELIEIDSLGRETSKSALFISMESSSALQDVKGDWRGKFDVLVGRAKLWRPRERQG